MSWKTGACRRDEVMQIKRFASALVLALCVTIPAFAETAGGTRRYAVVGWLGFRTDTIARDGLWQGLHELGYVDGKNIIFEYRFPEGTVASFAGPLEVLVRQKVNILAPAGSPATRAVPPGYVGHCGSIRRCQSDCSKFAESMACRRGT